VHYLHKALFSPTKSALLQAVKNGHLVTFPGLTEEAVHKHLKLAPAASMGHMNQRIQNIRSTSRTPIEDVQTTDTNLGTKTHLVYAVLFDQGQLYTDLMGNFPVRSSKGNSYVMVCYVYDRNYVKVVPINHGPPHNASRHMITSIKKSLPRVSNQNSKRSTTRYRPL
jgi:hypothetical protein